MGGGGVFTYFTHSGTFLIGVVEARLRQRDILMLLLQRLQERHEVLMVRELLGHGERHHHHVDRSVSISEGPEEWRDRRMEVLHRAFGSGRGLAVVPGVTHSYDIAYESQTAPYTVLY